MSQELYYTAPSESAFDSMKACAMKIWEGYDNQFAYVTEKIDRIRDLQNIGDNFMYIAAMFNEHNQEILMSMLSDEARSALEERMPS